MMMPRARSATVDGRRFTARDFLYSYRRAGRALARNICVRDCACDVWGFQNLLAAVCTCPSLNQAMWADVAHEDDFVSDAIDMRQIPGLGRTLVATRPITAGTVLLSELPLLMSVRELPRDTLQAVLDADTSAPSADTVKNAHAFVLAPEATQELFHCDKNFLLLRLIDFLQFLRKRW